MIFGRKVCVILPAYNAAKTLEMTVREIPRDVVDDVILVDDASRDNTMEVAEALGLHAVRHDTNKGYGGNQKTCYHTALRRGADIVIMLHPDYQYRPKLLLPMAALLALGLLRRGARIPHSRRRRACGRDAALQVRRQSRA